MYHLERLSLRNDFHAVAAYDQIAARCDAARTFRCHGCADWQELLRHPEIELLVIATPVATRVPLAVAALSAEKHVVLEPPLCLTLEEADRIAEAARQHGRTVTVAQLRRWDDDFRTALATLESGRLGELRMAKVIVWNYSPDLPAPLQANDSRSVDDDGVRSVLFEFGAHYFDQLLRLLPQPIQTVYGCLSSSSRSFLVIVHFAHDVPAHVELNLSSIVPLNTGWVLLGTAGGYHGFRRYESTDDGEIFHVPLEPLPTDWDLFYEGLIAHLRHNAPPPVSLEESRRVVALIDAVVRSATLGKPVCWVE
jgi:predicted dehydrogenase